MLPPDARDGSQRRPQLRDGDAASRFEFLVRFVEDLSLQAPIPGLLVLLEDMHWADRLSVLLLKHVSTELANLRICLVATFRDAASGEFSAALPELLRTPSGRQARLHRADRDRDLVTYPLNEKWSAPR